MKHRHHIIPKHMGGTDDKSNIAYITPLEHYKAHKKLYNRFKDRDSEVKLIDGTTKNTKWLAERNRISMNAALYVHENKEWMKHAFRRWGKKGAKIWKEKHMGIPIEFADYPIIPLAKALEAANRQAVREGRDKLVKLDRKTKKFRVIEPSGATYIITSGISLWAKARKIATTNMYAHFRKNKDIPFRSKGYEITLHTERKTRRKKK